MRSLCLILILLFSSQLLRSQNDLNNFLQPAAVSNNTRFSSVLIGTSLIYAVSMSLLYKTWYKKYPRSSFHFFNDNAEWLQMDKCGHATTAYNIAYVCYDLFRWSGKNSTQATWGGASVALAFLSSIEVLDGFSQTWGFSWGDMAANIAGAGLFAGQQFAFGEQKVTMKIGWNYSIYANYRPDLLGDNTAQRLLKDYNGQQYWLSFNIASILPVGKGFPKWLNIAAGQGVSGLLGGRENPELKDQNGNEIKFDRYRKWFIGTDVDFTKIPTNVTVLNPGFDVINIIKIPSPSLEFSPNQKIRFNPFLIHK
jgi:hypothetical protein